MNNLQFKILQKKILLSNIKVEIMSDSMTPLIKVGDKLDVGKIERDLRPFDIIIFHGPDSKLICHYVLKVFSNGHLVTTNLKMTSKRDATISKDVVLGIVTDKKISLYYKIKTFFSFII